MDAKTLTRQGIDLKKAGNTAGAVQLLAQAIEVNSQFEMAWLWLASCLSVDAEKRYCVEQALAINPDSQAASNALEKFRHVQPLRPAVLPVERPTVSIEAEPISSVQVALEEDSKKAGDATKICPFCAETIKAAAIVCRFCGRDLPLAGLGQATTPLLGESISKLSAVAPPPASAPPAPTKAVAPPKQSNSLTPALLLLVVLGCAILWIMGAFRSPASGNGSSAPAAAPATDSGADKIGAFLICKQFVTDRLKAPSTAEFPSSIDDGVAVSQLDRVQFSVRAFVDSQNGFGAMIRTRYTCTVRYLGDNNWQLQNLSTDDS